MVEDLKISVVIPIYNNIETVETCLESIYSQTYNNFECIMVDDCSDVDYSYLLQKYNSLTIVQLPENRGAGVARQYAIDNVISGDWIIFVDSDDVLYGRSVLSTFVRTIHRHPDVKIVKAKYIYNETGNHIYAPVEILNTEAIALHGILYNVNFLKENNIRFHDTLRYHEDVYFNLLHRYVMQYKCNDNEYLSISSIAYRQNGTAGSVTKRTYDGMEYFEAKFKDQVDMFLDLYDRVESFASINEIKKLFSFIFISGTIIVDNITDNHMKRLIRVGEHAGRIIEKLKTSLLKITTKEELISLILETGQHQSYDMKRLFLANNITHDPWKEIVYKINKLYSLYQFYKDNSPYQKVEFDYTSPLLSVIIPVYQSKGIINDTLDKLYNTLDIDLCEVIIVNDCSPDGEYEFLQDSYKNLKVLNNKYNKGYASSRQIGIDKASGKWLVFLDHDDELYPEIIDELLEVEKCDVPYQLLQFGSNYYYGTEIHPIRCANIDVFHGAVFNTKYLQDNSISFLSQLKSSEDCYFHRSIYNKLHETYFFLIKEKFSVPIYRWNIDDHNQTTQYYNRRCWMEENYGYHVRAQLLSLNNFDNSTYSEKFKVAYLYKLLYEAVTLSNIWSCVSKNFRYDILLDIQMIAAELNLYGCRYNNVDYYNELYHDSVIEGILEGIKIQQVNIPYNRPLFLDRHNYIHTTTIDGKVKEEVKNNLKSSVIKAFQRLNTASTYKNYFKIVAIDSPELKTLEPFKIEYMSKDQFISSASDNVFKSLYLYAIKSKEDLKYISEKQQIIKDIFRYNDIRYIIDDKLYWSCDRKLTDSIKCLYTIDSYDHDDVLSRNADLRYLLITGSVNIIKFAGRNL